MTEAKPYDFIVLRFVVQHLDKHLGEFFRKLHRLCHAGTRVVIIEGNAKAGVVKPPIESLADLAQLHVQFCELTGKLRTQVPGTPDICLFTGRSCSLEARRKVRFEFKQRTLCAAT